jgi:flagellar motor switch protein FliG
MSSDEGLLNGATLLLALGEEEAAEVLKHLTPKEVQKLGHKMAGLKNVSKAKIDGVLEKFHSQAASQSPLTMDSSEYIRSVLTKALGNDKAGFIIDRILQNSDTSGIESLKWMDAPTVAELIRNEHPQIIASILVHLERDHASAVLGQFVERLRNDVVLRIATLDGIQPDALRELNEVLARTLAGSDKLKKTSLGGVRTTAEILNFIGGNIETAVLDSLKEHDPDLAQKILDEMFVFENILDIDNKGIQVLLREVQSETLITALKGTSEPLREKIFSNMSQRAAEMLREDLESKGPVRVSDVEAAQKEILKIVRRLADEGQIALGGKGEEQFV